MMSDGAMAMMCSTTWAGVLQLGDIVPLKEAYSLLIPCKGISLHATACKVSFVRQLL